MSKMQKTTRESSEGHIDVHLKYVLLKPEFLPASVLADTNPKYNGTVPNVIKPLNNQNFTGHIVHKVYSEKLHTASPVFSL